MGRNIGVLRAIDVPVLLGHHIASEKGCCQKMRFSNCRYFLPVSIRFALLRCLVLRVALSVLFLWGLTNAFESLVLFWRARSTTRLASVWENPAG